MNIFPQIFLALIVACSFNATAQSVREEVLLKDHWRFIADTAKQGQSAGWHKGLPARAIPVQVPHTWNVMSGYENYTGLAWYEKKITIPSQWKNKHLRLKFAAVYHDATIYLNGVKLQEHNNAGYTTFYVDLPGQLNSHAANTLVVSVSNAYSATNLPFQRAFDWCNDGGIIREVTLQASGKPSLRYVHVSPAIDFKDTTAKATVALRLWEEHIDTLNAVINIRERKTARSVYQNTVTLYKSGNTFSTIADLGKIHLWHFNDPFLYDITVTTKKNGRSADQLTSHFGCRTIGIQGKIFLLNQEPVRLPGIEYMPGSYPLYGNAEPRWVMDSVVRLKARIHGITDLYLRKKPSYYIFKQLACPVEISNVKKINDTRIRVGLLNKNTLPSYTLRNYVIKWKDQQGKNREQQLPVMKPGDTATIELENMQPRFAFDITDPAGFRVMSYPFIY